MSKHRLILWTLVAWPTPALLAGALGWEGIWGSGSALVDYLIPVPVAGGALHVVSFVLCGAAVARIPTLGVVGASRMRAALFGVTLVGVLWLLQLPDILLAWQTDSTRVGGLWQENPLGLFLASDGLIALIFSAVGAQPPLLRIEALTVALGLLPGALPLAMAWPESADEQPFKRGAGEVGQTRGDETYFVFTRVAPHAEGFRERAHGWAAAPGTFMDPRFHVDNEDVAIMFSEDLDAADRRDRTQVAATLCLYEDGTEPRWLSGAGDCFGDHLNFSERLERVADARSSDGPREVQFYLAARELCRNVQVASAHGGAGVEITPARICGALARMRDELQQKYPDTASLHDPA